MSPTATIILETIGLTTFFFPMIIGTMLLVGGILAGIGFYTLGDKYNESLVNVGGILSIFLLPFIGYIRTWENNKQIIIRTTHSSLSIQPMIPQTSLPIYQMGSFAIMRPDGSVTFQVYSTQPAQLVSATIEGTGNTSTVITPNLIQPNQITTVTINFGPILVSPGRQYKILVTAVINGTTVQFPVYAIS